MTRFEELPMDIQLEIRDTLKAFDTCHVTFSNGCYHVGCGVCLMREYPKDFRVVGDYNADEIYTVDERIENYVNEFHSFPPQYKGMMNWKLMREMDEDRSIKVAMVCGNIVRVA